MMVAGACNRRYLLRWWGGSLSSSFRGLAHPRSTSTGSPMWAARLEIDDALTALHGAVGTHLHFAGSLAFNSSSQFNTTTIVGA